MRHNSLENISFMLSFLSYVFQMRQNSLENISFMLSFLSYRGSASWRWETVTISCLRFLPFLAPPPPYPSPPSNSPPASRSYSTRAWRGER